MPSLVAVLKVYIIIETHSEQLFVHYLHFAASQARSWQNFRDRLNITNNVTLLTRNKL